MRLEKSVYSQKELLEFLNIEGELEKEKARRWDIISFAEGIQKIGEFNKEKEVLFNASSEAKNGLFKEFKLEKKLFWLFIEYFLIITKMPLKKFMGHIERCIILRTLYKVNGNQKEAAQILGVKYTTLNEKIKKYKIYL